MSKQTKSSSLVTMTRIAALAVTLAASLMSSPAQAETRSFTDPVGDVAHGMDIRKVTVANGDRLKITLHHRAVREQDGAWSGAYIDVTPNRSASPNYYIVGSVGGHYDLYWMDGWSVGGRLGCPGPGTYRQSYNFDRDTTRFTLARSCLNGASFRATRVRVSAVAGAEPGSDWAPRYHRYTRWVALR